jgi:hypothetical protein
VTVNVDTKPKHEGREKNKSKRMEKDLSGLKKKR